jgi:hypothetical protein
MNVVRRVFFFKITLSIVQKSFVQGNLSETILKVPKKDPFLSQLFSETSLLEGFYRTLSVYLAYS